MPITTSVPVMEVQESNLQAAQQLFPNSITVYIDGTYWMFLPFEEADALCNHLYTTLYPKQN